MKQEREATILSTPSNKEVRRTMETREEVAHMLRLRGQGLTPYRIAPCWDAVNVKQKCHNLGNLKCHTYGYFMGWKRGRPPAPRPPRKRGRAFTRGLSWEQIPVLTAVDRDAAKWEQVLGYRDDMPDALLCGTRTGSVLCTDDWPGFARAARQATVPHFVFPSRSSRKPKKDGPKALCEAVAGTLSLARVNALQPI